MTKSDWLNAMRPEDRDIIRLGPDGRCTCDGGTLCPIGRGWPNGPRCTSKNIEAAGFELHAPDPPIICDPGPSLTAVAIDGVVQRPPQFDRPPREDYVRCSVETPRVCMEPAVEWRHGDDFDAIAELLEHEAGQIAARFDDCSPIVQAQLIADRIAKRWPDRAHFVESWQTGKRGFAQCVQPAGFPRNRP